MRDVVSSVQERRGGAMVHFEGGEALWFGRAAWRERLPLSPGDEEELEELKAWLLPRQYAEALDGAVRLLSVRARSEGEIRRKLTERGYMDDTVDMVLYKLEKEGLVDDEAFAREWAASRARSQVGRARILRELTQKGLSRACAQRAVAALDAQEGEDAAEALARKLLRRYAGEADEKKAMGKMLAAMARRGYGFEEARRALEAAMRRED